MRSSIAVLTLAFLLPSLVPAAPPAPAEVLERFNVVGDGDALLVPVTIQGKTYSFLVDTGASYTCYDTSLRPLLGRRVDSSLCQGAEVACKLDRYLPPKAHLGKLPLSERDPVVIYDMADVRRLTGLDIRGILGMDFMKDHVVQIDFDKGSLAILQSVGPDEGHTIALLSSKFTNLVGVEADVCGNGLPDRFQVDTGNGSSGMMRADLFDTLLRLGKMEKAGEERFFSIGHDSYNLRGRLDRLTLGPFAFPGLVITSSASNASLGLSFWSRFRVAFDFPAGKLYLRKGKRFDHRDEPNKSGLHIHRPATKTIVDGVDPDSPSAKAGIQPGDVIVSIASVPAKGSRLFSLREQLCTSRPTVPLTLERDGKTRQVTLQIPGQNPPASAP